MQKATLTGAEVEALGLMKFACDKCRELFPRRCDEHHVIVLIKVEEEEPEPPKLELLLLLKQRVPDRKILGSGKPMLEYTAPYERLEADIADTLRAQRE